MRDQTFHISFWEPYRKLQLRHWADLRRKMPTISRHPIAILIIWCALIIASGEYIGTNTPRFADAVTRFATEIAIIIFWPLLMFSELLLPSHITVRRIGIRGMRWQLQWEQVRRIQWRRFGDGALLRVRGQVGRRRVQRLMFMPPEHIEKITATIEHYCAGACHAR